MLKMGLLSEDMLDMPEWRFAGRRFSLLAVVQLLTATARAEAALIS